MRLQFFERGIGLLPHLRLKEAQLLGRESGGAPAAVRPR
jgi:hypothetical protein